MRAHFILPAPRYVTYFKDSTLDPIIRIVIDAISKILDREAPVLALGFVFMQNQVFNLEY